MSKVYVSEYASIGNTANGSVQSAAEPALTSYVLDTGSGVISSAFFQPDTRLVRVHTDGIISYAFGTAPTATTSSPRMAANQTEYFGVPRGVPGAANEGYKISAITNT